MDNMDQPEITRARDEVAMALHMTRGIVSREAIEICCRFFRLTEDETAEVLNMRSPHPGRECSPDCAEFGCASWTAVDPAARNIS